MVNVPNLFDDHCWRLTGIYAAQSLRNRSEITKYLEENTIHQIRTDWTACDKIIVIIVN